MRELKFRCWDTDTKKMYIECSLLSNIVDTGENRVKYLTKYKTFTYMQFTGLKDKNEKEIYEGDIVKLRDYYGWDNRIVSYDENKCCFKTGQKHEHGCGKDGVNPMLLKSNVEVIGNIYENNELLK